MDWFEEYYPAYPIKVTHSRCNDLRELPSNIDAVNISFELDNIENLLLDEKKWEADELSMIIYYNQIRKFKELSQEEEVELISKAQQGNADAFDKVVKANLKLVVHIAKKYQNLGLPFNDLISEGNIALLKAIMSFDLSYGYKFISYLWPCVKGAILSALRSYNRLRWGKDNTYKLVKFINQFTLENGQKPSLDDIQQLFPFIKDEDIEMALVYPGYMFSIEDIKRVYPSDYELFLNHAFNAYNINNDSAEVSYVIDEYLLDESFDLDLDNALKKLKPREEKILRMFFGIGYYEMSLEEIALKFDLSRERIRQLKERAIRRLRGKINKDKVNDLRIYLR